MTTAPLAAGPSAAELTATSRARTRGLRAGAALAAGGLLTAVLGLSAPAVASTATAFPADAWSQGPSARGWGSSGGYGGQSGYGGQGAYGQQSSGDASSSTVDSDPATSAESRGVALIDTVLSDGAAAGTGIVLTSDGEVLTNYHVVEGSTSVKVTLPGSGTSPTTYTATVVGADQAADVALLQLKGASGLTTATIDDDTLKVGDDVTAVGNAGGTGSLTAADGAVTDLSTSITTQSEGTVAGERLTKLIETSADVVAGDSGGPLLDREGEVVGMDTAASSGQEVDGYAVPIATALAVVAQIRSGDETAAVRIGPAAFLGVEIASSAVDDLGDGAAYGYGYGSTFGSGAAAGTSGAAGAPVAGVVDGGAAAEAGIGAGDTVTKVGSTDVTSASDLTDALATLNPGDRVKVTWTSADGSVESATVTLGSSPLN